MAERIKSYFNIDFLVFVAVLCYHLFDGSLIHVLPHHFERWEIQLVQVILKKLRSLHTHLLLQKPYSVFDL